MDLVEMDKDMLEMTLVLVRMEKVVMDLVLVYMAMEVLVHLGLVE